jgi:thioredoxin
MSFSVVVLSTGCAQNNTQNAEAGMNTEQTQPATVVNVDPADFKSKAESGKGIILDVRTPQEIATGTIENASTIDFYAPDFEQKISMMDKSKEIYVYCKAGGRSAQATEILIKNGFTKVYNLNGGITAWQNQGYSITPSSAKADANIKALTSGEFHKVLELNKVVLADFHTQWCSPCRKMAPVVDELEKTYNGKASVMRIDTDQSKDLAKEYSISGVPVFVIFKNGKEVWRKTGAMPKEELVSALETYLK